MLRRAAPVATVEVAPNEPLALPRRSFLPRYLLGIGVLAGSALAALGLGSTAIDPESIARIVLSHLPGIELDEDISATWRSIIWEIRLPRVLLAGLAGATLAMAGATYQGVFRNPLAEPYLIGVATGANLAATIVVVSGASLAWHGLSLLPVAAFAGALASVGAAYAVARFGRAAPSTTLILAGVALSSLSTAVTTYLMIKNTSNSLTIFSSVLGGFNGTRWVEIAWVLPYVVIAPVVILAHGRILNVLSLDDEQARHLGIDVERTKLVLLGAASLAAAAAVAVSGTIGFVGLIVPHAVRLVWGPDNRQLLPMTILLGAAFLIGADLLARTLDSPSEIPVGIITAFFGVPFFLYLLRRSGGAAYL